MSLVIVESAPKVQKLSKILGDDYIVVASLGHIMDLDPNSMALNLETFEPNYVYYEKSDSIIKKIKKGYSLKKHLVIASDLDREGEFIGESIRKLLNVKNYDRIIFNEITEKAIIRAINNPVKLDYDKINAQQTRRYLDRIFGYGVTPLLKRIPGIDNNIGCGRVQSGFVKLIVDKEREIEQFIKNLRNIFFEGTGIFDFNGVEIKMNLIPFSTHPSIKLPVNEMNLSLIFHYLSVSPLADWTIDSIKSKQMKQSPKPPFTTASLQTDAANKLGWSVKKTMNISQQLYEKGYITYIRTDSVALSDDAVEACKNKIIEDYGKEYYEKREYKNDRSDAQEAHEAIRPCYMNKNHNFEDKDMSKLFNLIKNRTLSSLMKDSIIESVKIVIKPFLHNKEEMFCMTGNKCKTVFKGFKIIYDDEEDKEDIDFENCEINFKSLTVKENIKNPPQRYNEAQLVKAVTKLGIGRPGTTANFIDKIQTRNYVAVKDVEGIPMELMKFSVFKNCDVKFETFKEHIGSDKNRMVPTKKGLLVNDFLEENFPQLMDLKFTANLEKQLSEICEGKLDWKKVLTDFYSLLNSQMEKVKSKYKIQSYTTDACIIGNYENEPIEFFKSKFGYCIKTTINFKNFYVTVSEKPSEEEAIKLFEKKLSKPQSTIFKKFNKSLIVRLSDNGSYFLQAHNKKKVKFFPIRSDPKLITKDLCMKIAKNFLQS